MPQFPFTIEAIGDNSRRRIGRAHSLHEAQEKAAAASPSAGETVWIRVWDEQSGEEIRRFPAPNAVANIQLGPDEFRPDLNRYHFNSGECNPAETDFCQVDTPQDAIHFGIWADPVGLRVVKFIESEVYRHKHDSEAAFVGQVRSVLKTHRKGEGHASIDPHGNLGDWRALGFDQSDFLFSQ
jgi:hypothetical protein